MSTDASSRTLLQNVKSFPRIPRAALSDTGIIIKDQVPLYQHQNDSLTSCISCSSALSTSSVQSQSPKSIPFEDILAANLCSSDTGDDTTASEDTKDIEVVFARKRGSNLVPTSVVLSIDGLGYENIVDEIYKRSYLGTKPKQSILVIINPHGGKGRAMKMFISKAKPILSAAGAKINIVETQYFRHAIKIAKELNIEEYDIIACASGDGIPHEVLNGLFQREDRVDAFNNIAVTQIPCGSGNAMSISCHGTSNPSFAALSLLKSIPVNMDLMACTQGSQTSVSFLSQTYGIIAESDIKTESLRWMGPKRFDLGVAYQVLKGSKFPCEIAVKYAAKSKNEVRAHYNENLNKIFENNTLATVETFQLKYDLKDSVPDDWEYIDQKLTDNLGIFYTGKMPYIAKDCKFFPATLPNDGTIDLVITDSRTSLSRMAPILLSLDEGTHVLQPEVQHSKILAFRLIPKLSQGVISIDGESFPFEPLQVEVLPGAAKTLLKHGSYVATNF